MHIRNKQINLYQLWMYSKITINPNEFLYCTKLMKLGQRNNSLSVLI